MTHFLFFQTCLDLSAVIPEYRILFFEFPKQISRFEFQIIMNINIAIHLYIYDTFLISNPVLNLVFHKFGKIYFRYVNMFLIIIIMTNMHEYMSMFRTKFASTFTNEWKNSTFSFTKITSVSFEDLFY